MTPDQPDPKSSPAPVLPASELEALQIPIRRWAFGPLRMVPTSLESALTEWDSKKRCPRDGESAKRHAFTAIGFVITGSTGVLGRLASSDYIGATLLAVTALFGTAHYVVQLLDAWSSTRKQNQWLKDAAKVYYGAAETWDAESPPDQLEARVFARYYCGDESREAEAKMLVDTNAEAGNTHVQFSQGRAKR